MRKTIITKNIEGVQVVLGLGRAVIDPVVSRPLVDQPLCCTDEWSAYTTCQALHKTKVDGLHALVVQKRQTMVGAAFQAEIEQTDEYKNWLTVKEEADWNNPVGNKALSDAWNAYKAKEKAIISSMVNINAAFLVTDEYVNWIAAKETAAGEIKTAYDAVLAQRKAILEAGGDEIYFTPKAGEEFVSDVEAQEIKARLEALPEKTRLTKVEGQTIANWSTIEDRRGESCWYQDESERWNRGAVTSIGKTWPVDAVFKEEMTPEIQIEIVTQQEEDRLGGLSRKEKQAEYEQCYQGLLSAAAMQKQKKEIEGMDPAQALSESQAWLASENALIKTKYGV